MQNKKEKMVASFKLFMSLYLNGPKIFGNPVGNYSRLYSYIQQIYIVYTEGGGISIFILLLVKTASIPLRMQKA